MADPGVRPFGTPGGVKVLPPLPESDALGIGLDFFRRGHRM
jgi:hypothetical protein